MFSNLVRPSSLLANELRLVLPKRGFSLKSPLNTNGQVSGVSQKTGTNKSRYLLYSLTGLGGLSLAYYELALDSKEKRRVHIMMGGCVRAVRSFLTGVAIGIDYKWSLWGLEEVYIGF